MFLLHYKSSFFRLSSRFVSSDKYYLGCIYGYAGTGSQLHTFDSFKAAREPKDFEVQLDNVGTDSVSFWKKNLRKIQFFLNFLSCKF